MAMGLGIVFILIGVALLGSPGNRSPRHLAGGTAVTTEPSGDVAH